jgi:hypothetical protein
VFVVRFVRFVVEAVGVEVKIGERFGALNGSLLSVIMSDR